MNQHIKQHPSFYLIKNKK